MIDTQITLQLSILLDKYFTEDMAEMKCSMCCIHLSHCPLSGLCRPKPVNSTKCFSKAPEQLIIQLNRFNRASGKRVTTVVKADEIIELPTEENREKVYVKYSLSSVIDFIGESTNCGHYISHVKGSNGWLTCNDTNISHSSQGEFETNRNYVYHYSRMNKYNKKTFEIQAEEKIRKSITKNIMENSGEGPKNKKSKVEQSKQKIGQPVFKYPEDEISNEMLSTISTKKISNQNIHDGNKIGASLEDIAITKKKE